MSTEAVITIRIPLAPDRPVAETVAWVAAQIDATANRAEVTGRWADEAYCNECGGPLLPDFEAKPPHNDTDTSKEAAWAKWPTAGHDREVVLLHVRDQPYGTCTRDSISVGIGMADSGVDGRVRELIKGGFLEEPPGMRRKTQRGRNAKVVVPTPKALGL